MKKENVLELFALFFLSLCLTNDIFSQTNFVWGKQFGSDKNEAALNVVSDKDGNIYVGGNTNGVLGESNYGNEDGFVSKIDSSGNLIWTKQIGTKSQDRINWIASDVVGNVYITGDTKGNLDGNNKGKEDIIVAKIDRDGNLIWQKQFGSDSLDIGNVVYVDNQGFVYIAGTTNGLLGKSQFGKSDCFILKLDNNGNKQYINQFGTPEEDGCRGLTKDLENNIYVCGDTWGSLASKNIGYNDAFVSIFNDKGELIKAIQFGTDTYEDAACLKVDKEKNIYIGGSTLGNIASEQIGEGDAFLTKINSKGDFVWTKQFGTKRWDGVLGIDLKENVSDNIIVSGCQRWPDCQSFCRMFDQDGNQLWVRNSTATGKAGGTCGKGVCITDKGFVVHTGLTGANQFGSNAGEHDVFLYLLELDKSLKK